MDRLKQAKNGLKVAFLVSRVEEDDKENKETDPVAEQPKDKPSLEEHEFIIPLNSTGSAGLGIRLKARVTVRSDKTRVDCGIFIKDVRHYKSCE